LVGLKVQSNKVMAVLASSLDLGAILLSETYAHYKDDLVSSGESEFF